MNRVPALERGLAILDLFSPTRQSLKASYIAAQLDIPRSTLHRLLICLVKLGMLQRQPDCSFGLGPGALAFGAKCIAIRHR